MDHFILHIFPQASLASSVTTTVWVGICVAVFFNMRFGWTLSGLVVPGYLVPLIIMKPLSAVVIIFEGVVTYLIVLYLFEYLSLTGIWSPVFGRDRFFALLVFSVIIRIIFDGFLLPAFGEYINQRFSLNFDYRNHLHSFGLIIVALIANQFWKPGFFRGIIPLGVMIGVTYIIVRYGLIEYTNFSISNLGYLYEDIASSMIASPKAYIILLTTAFLASHMNLNYGWEYSGILIPSLIALLWYQPAKIGVTIAETTVILITASALLKLPMLKNTTIEGARKIFLFFNISYAYKFILAYVILYIAPDNRITDYYGFGYLLSSLMAIKMHDKEIFARVVRVTIQTSLYAIVISCLLGFGLTLLPNFWSSSYSTKETTTPQMPHRDENQLLEIIQLEKQKLYQKRLTQKDMVPLAKEMDLFSQSIHSILDYIRSQNTNDFSQAHIFLSQLNYQIDLVENKYLVLRDKDASRCWGTYVFDISNTRGLVVELPMPLLEKDMIEAGMAIFQTMRCRALAISGMAQKNLLKQKTPSVLITPMTFFQVFHNDVGSRNILQINAINDQNIQTFLKHFQKEQLLNQDDLKSALWVKSSLPSDLNMSILKSYFNNFSLIWRAYPETNIQRQTTYNGFAELFLKPSDIKNLLLKTILANDDIQMIDENQNIEGYLRDWLIQGDHIAPKGSEKYVVPDMNELLFFDKEIVKPIIQTIQHEYVGNAWTHEGLITLKSIAKISDTFNYRVFQYHHSHSKKRYLILCEKDHPDKRKYWGTYVFRIGNSSPFVIQIPRPMHDLNVFQFGVSIFERMQGQALLIAGAHKNANLNGSSDIVRRQNRHNTFNLVSQVIIRENMNHPLMIVQTRAFAYSDDQPAVDSDMIVSFASGHDSETYFSELENNLLQTLQKDRYTWRLIDGSKTTAGFEVAANPQSTYLRQSANKEFTILWLSPKTRSYHRQQHSNYAQQAQFKALGIPIVKDYLLNFLTQNAVWSEKNRDVIALQKKLKSYVKSQDILILKSIKNGFRKYRLSYFLDLNTAQAYILIYTKRKRLVGVMNLLPKDFESSFVINKMAQQENVIQRFIETRGFWLSKRK